MIYSWLGPFQLSTSSKAGARICYFIFRVIFLPWRQAQAREFMIIVFGIVACVIKILPLTMMRRERRVLGLRTGLWELSSWGLAFAGE
jgi:hypothetical protein